VTAKGYRCHNGFMHRVYAQDHNMFLAIAEEAWLILVESAPYILFGFLVAGLLKGLLPEGLVARQLGRSSFGSVVKASLLGIPLPLCSCGVIPAAIGLRQQGASKGASAAFLVSTPESGVDSMAITWALLDPLMTIIRPAAAFLTATVTGVLINVFPDHIPPPTNTASCSSDCGCSSESEGTDESAAPQTKEPARLSQKLRDGLSFAFKDLLKDIGGWLLLGVLLAGIIAYAVPEDFAHRWLGGEITSLLIMLVVGVPLYICATASTPIAAAMVLKGLSPGAALVFLLAGPATNVATITVIRRFFGGKATAIYLASIAVCSVATGWLVNRLYEGLGIDLVEIVTAGLSHEEGPYLFEKASAIVLLLLLLNSMRTARKDTCGCED